VQLSHQTDLHAHDNNGSCEICLFASNLHNAVPPVAVIPPPPQTNYYFTLSRYESPRLTQPCLLVPRLRGPPSLSIA
jgi:hypothetical protein